MEPLIHLLGTWDITNNGVLGTWKYGVGFKCDS